MITRKEYMTDSANLHQAYYAQFITEATRRYVLGNVGMSKLKASTDRHLNDVTVKRYDSGLTVWNVAPVNVAKAIDAGECVANPTPSCRTCTAKEAARVLLEEHTL